MPATLHKLLLCPACEAVMAEAEYRRWPTRLTLTSPEGYSIQPMGAALQTRLAERLVAEATSAGEKQLAEARLAFLRRNLEELVFDLRCRDGHSTLRTMPQLVRAVRRTPGQWVTLS